MQYLRKATACTIMFGPFVDKTDGVTLKTDATTITDIDHATTGIFVSKAGAAAAIRHATVTASVADAYGMMKVTLDTTDTGTTGTLDVLFAKAATYLPVSKQFTVLEQVVYDVLFGTVALATVSNITSSAGAVLGATGLDSIAYNSTGAQALAKATWVDAVAGDFTVAGSIGKSVMNGVALGTGLTINGYTGNTPQTGDAYARIGAAGAGLTGITGVTLAATQTGVTIPTVTNLTNAPTNGDLTAAMKTSVTTAATAATPNLNAAYDAAKTAAPTAAANAAAVLAAAATAPIASNIKKVNDSAISGAGTEASPWGP